MIFVHVVGWWSAGQCCLSSYLSLPQGVSKIILNLPCDLGFISPAAINALSPSVGEVLGMGSDRSKIIFRTGS